MTPEEFRQALTALHITHGGAAVLFGVTIRTASRWASGESAIPRCVDLALGLMIRHGIRPDDVLNLDIREELANAQSWGAA